MTWFSRLYQTYDRAIELAKSTHFEGRPLPIFHIEQDAHIEVTIDGEGNFLDARLLDKATPTCIPSTEKSAGRTNNPPPHPLSDQLVFLAGDICQYGVNRGHKFSQYLDLINSWFESQYNHSSLNAIYWYVSKKTLTADLIRSAVLTLNDRGELAEYKRDSEWDQPSPIFKKLKYQEKALVRWKVQLRGNKYENTWEDSLLQNCWINFCNSQENVDTDFCYVLGIKTQTSSNHPKFIRRAGDSAKLISSNDFNGFTFRGRFTDKSKSAAKLQPVAISTIASQKAHLALQWLIRRQKIRNTDFGDTLIVWAVSSKPVIHPCDTVETYDFLFDINDQSDPARESESVEKNNRVDHSRDTGFTFARKLESYMLGQRKDLTVDDTISVMAIDAATPGRMAVTYYRESMPNDYLDGLEAWHRDFAWCFWSSKRVEGDIRAPSVYEVIYHVLGDKAQPELKSKLLLRLLPSILHFRDIPIDLLSVMRDRVVKLTSKNRRERERSLSIACALFRGHYKRYSNDSYKSREMSVSLDKKNNSRDYLYGRLLALAEKLESRALYLSGDNRPTTTDRLMHQFSNRPYSTWLNIYKQLDPYMRYLKRTRPGFLTNIRKEIDEVMSAFDRNGYMSDAKLSGEFLLGFSCQRREFLNQPENENELKRSN